MRPSLGMRGRVNKDELDFISKSSRRSNRRNSSKKKKSLVSFKLTEKTRGIEKGEKERNYSSREISDEDINRPQDDDYRI